MKLIQNGIIIGVGILCSNKNEEKSQSLPPKNQPLPFRASANPRKAKLEAKPVAIILSLCVLQHPAQKDAGHSRGNRQNLKRLPAENQLKSKSRASLLYSLTHLVPPTTIP